MPTLLPILRALHTALLTLVSCTVIAVVLAFAVIGTAGIGSAGSAEVAADINGPSTIAAVGNPQWLQQAYDLTALSARAGYGDTVAVVDIGVGYEPSADLSLYRKRYDLPACTTSNHCLRIVNEHGGRKLPRAKILTNSDWGSETAIDLDAVSALCPHCHLLLVEASSDLSVDAETAEVTAYHLGANQISDSWGYRSGPISSDFVFPGVATVASTGDLGYTPTGAEVFPAAFAGVTAAGATALFNSQRPSARGVDEQGSAYSSNFCSDLSKPPWQGRANTSCSGRAVADISADGELDTGLDYYYAADGPISAGFRAGGTSLSAPLIAAYYALIESTPQGRNYGVDGAAWAYDNPAFLNNITKVDVGANGDGTTEDATANDADTAGNATADNADNDTTATAADTAKTGLAQCSPQIFPTPCKTSGGYSGVSGVGSISGAAVPGVPGVTTAEYDCSSEYESSDCEDAVGKFVTSHGSTTVTLEGGVYPNQLRTRYWWEYGPTPAYGFRTTPKDIGAGTKPVLVTNTVTGPVPSSGSYYYALFAENADGTISYDPEVGSTVDALRLPARRHHHAKR